MSTEVSPFTEKTKLNIKSVQSNKETISCIILRKITNINAIFPSCFPHHFHSFEVWLPLLITSSRCFWLKFGWKLDFKLFMFFKVQRYMHHHPCMCPRNWHGYTVFPSLNCQRSWLNLLFVNVSGSWTFLWPRIMAYGKMCKHLATV